MAWEWAVIDGFEWANSEADLRTKYRCYTTSTISFDSSVKKTGTQSLKFGPATAENELHMPIPLWYFDGAISLHMGFHIRQTAMEARTYNTDPIVGTWDNASGQEINLTQTAGGVPELRLGSTLRATGSSGFAANTWHWLEIFWTCVDSGARGIVAIDDNTVIDYTGDLRNITGRMEFIRIEGLDSATQSMNIDNLFCRVSKDEESPPTFYGPCYVRTTVPDADGNYTAWSSTSTASPPVHYTELDDQPADSPETYLSSSTGAQRASFSHGAVGLDNPGNDVILAVSLEHQGTHASPGGGTVAPFVRISSTDYDGSSQGFPHGGYQRRYVFWENSPATASAWTEAELNGAEFGVQFEAS